MKREKILSLSSRGMMQSGASKLLIVLCALVFAFAPTGAHADACYSKSKFGTIYDFGDHAGDPLSPQSVGVIAQGRDGNFWSTTPAGGTSTTCANGCGTAFKLTPEGKLSVTYNFSNTTGQPYSGLTLGTDGNFYGTTYNGGKYGDGTVFRLTPKRVLTVLWNFKGRKDGAIPKAPPIEGMDGNLYGTTYQGGANNLGTIYQLTPSRKLTTMHQFAVSDGANPIGALVQGTDGNLYGTASAGGDFKYCGSGCGTIFKIAPFGDFTFTLLHAFTGFDYSGGFPNSALFQGSAGKFYGTTANGGDAYGLIFDITSNGFYTALYDLNGSSNGAYPIAGLVQATDGNFYGAADQEGTDYGTFYRITPVGKFTECEDFNDAYGATPTVTPIQHTNGMLYGDTNQGGHLHNTGVFYYVNLGLKPFVSLLPTSGKVGSTVEILGQGFIRGKTAVSFNGTPATKFPFVSATYITVVVPGKATSGFVTVTTPTATLKSNRKFQVLE
jgi:uncharacterized repeat protein (TIGR03803 family)